jgi:hypothetical protein
MKPYSSSQCAMAGWKWLLAFGCLLQGKIVKSYPFSSLFKRGK